MNFNHIPFKTHHQHLSACPVCGCPGEMWEVVDEDGSAQKTGMCSRSDSEHGPLAKLADCPPSLPPGSFRQPSYRTAASFWNGFAEACAQSRKDMAFRMSA